MKKFILLITGLWLYSILFQPAILGCTIFKVTRDGVTLVGNNEDGTDATTYLWFIPASKGKYGRVYFTLGDKWQDGKYEVFPGKYNKPLPQQGGKMLIALFQ